ncbi:hypothetical protein H0H87_006180 [Tephrocybe sp. NHM501043]|nr:hypothetical protein H0H87_006180 [Tephrocybe sp. NHM501043]
MSTSASRVCICSQAANLRCSGCSKKWYCSKRCQKMDWQVHIFQCKVNMPIKTSYYLARAVRENLIPDDPQTLEDYGFDRAVTNTEKSMLLGLYIGLIERMDISPKEVNRWFVQGSLTKEIKAAYETLPSGSQGGYYPWFLKNQHILDHSIPVPKSSRDNTDDATVRAWRLAGGSSKDSLEDIRLKIPNLPRSEQLCLNLYTILLGDDLAHPHPALETWITFGFCACRSTESEGLLGGLYHKLIKRCTFKEFVKGYEDHALVKLFDSKGLPYNPLRLEHVEEFFAGENSAKSVWYLKQFIEVRDFPDFESPPSVAVDYGFMNCQNMTEVEDLKALYKQIFDMPKMSPLELHDACIQGKLFEFVERFVALKKKVTRKQLRRILKNPYPLADY